MNKKTNQTFGSLNSDKDRRRKKRERDHKNKRSRKKWGNKNNWK